MKVPSHYNSGSLGFNMTPMIDVVFLLIIFFLVSSHLASREVHLELPLPEAASGQASTSDAAPRITVNVLQDGTLSVAGRELSTEELQARLQQRVAEQGQQVQVRIRGDRNVPYRFVEPVMVACVRSGIWDVSYSVFRREEP